MSLFRRKKHADPTRHESPTGTFEDANPMAPARPSVPILQSTVADPFLEELTPAPQPPVNVTAPLEDVISDRVSQRVSERLSSRLEAYVDAAINRVIETLESRLRVPEPAVVIKPVEDDISFDESNPDEKFASVIRQFVGRAPSSTSLGEIIEVTIIGQLKNGDTAWFNEDLTVFGTLTRDQLGDIAPLTDDKLRVRVVSYPWGHVVTGVVPYSLVSPFAVRDIPQATVDTAGTPPANVLGTPFERLRPGDIVLARVPYDGTGRLDSRGQTGKFRPAVFIKWQEDYAWLRAIYDAHGYVASNDLGIKLVDTNALDKASVVRNAEFDIAPANIVRHLGRLGQRDLNALNIEEHATDTPQGAAPAPVNYARKDLDPVSREIPNVIAAVGTVTSASSLDEVLARMIGVFRDNDVLRKLLETEGIHFSMVGHVFAEIIKNGGLTMPKGTFRALFHSAMAQQPAGRSGNLVLRQDENNHPVLWIGTSAEALEQPEPIDRHEVPRTGARLMIDEEYLVPDIIIYDQESAAVMMQDTRIDLAVALADLRAGGVAPGYIIGSDAEIGWASFQNAARHRGWKTSPASDRAEVIAMAMKATNEADAEVVTIVGYFPDLIAELENNGFEVNEVNQLEE